VIGYGLGMQTNRANQALRLIPVRALTLNGTKKDPFLSAASGLQRVGDQFHVVADDRLDLGTFTVDPESGGDVQKILDRPSLPQDEKARKAVKPDLESLTMVEHDGGQAMLAFGSGSTAARNTGVFIPMDHQGSPGDPIEFDLSPLYESLSADFPELNIEGSAPMGESLRLLQRGNGTTGPNAVIDLALADVTKAASSGGPLTPEMIRAIKPVELGTTPGSNGPVPWTFTDLTSLPDGQAIFTATAEDTDNPYDDGEILGSAVGMMDADGSVTSLAPVDRRIKIEGVTTDDSETYLVTDADDPHKPAMMYRLADQL
jgi:hypothetical protein